MNIEQLINQGKIIEAGWQGLRAASIPTNAPQVQIDEMRQAFFAGAQYLFSSIMSTMESGNDPIENFRLIDGELRLFINELMMKNIKAQGGIQ